MEQDRTSTGVAQKDGKNGGPGAPAQNVPEVGVRVIAHGKPDILVPSMPRAAMTKSAQM